MMLGSNCLLGNYFTYQRFAVFGVPMLLIVLTDPVPRPALSASLRLVQRMVFALPLTFVLIACFLFAGFDQESRGYREIAEVMKPGKRVLGLIINNASVVFNQPMYLHYASWYQAEQRGVADFSFAQFGLLVSYRPGADIPIQRGFEWFPQTFDWQRHEGWLYDYFIVRSAEDVSRHLFRTADRPVGGFEFAFGPPALGNVARGNEDVTNALPLEKPAADLDGE